MPSTSKKQHNFMAAIANNPSFAKKVGIPQSVGKDFSAADKGRKFEKGGATMMGKKIPNAMADMMARRRPRMGAGMPPPVPMGMKKGGKVRRFEEGGITDGPNKNIDDDTRARALAFVAKNEPPTTNYSDADLADPAFRVDSFASKVGKRPSTQVSSAPTPKTETPQATQTAKPIPSNETNAGAVTGRTFKRPTMLKTDSSTAPKQTVADGEDFGAVNEDESRNSRAVTGRVDKVSKNMPSAAKKEENTERLGEGMLTAATLIPAGRLAKGAYTLNAERLRRAEQLSSMKERKARFANRRSAANAKEAAYDARRASDMEAGFKKGGAMKFAKGGMAHGGMHKMPNGKMMKNSAMKEGGMPMKDGKPAFMMGKKKMMGGGMAKGTNMNPKGSTSGSSRAGENTKIQKRGLTEGRMIKMAAGGSVGSASRRADGIAQRGKTRG